jgi:hypothetical protein
MNDAANVCIPSPACYPQSVRRAFLALFCIVLPVTFAAGFAGCKHAPAIPEPQPSAAREAQQQVISDALDQLNQIPPPAKTRYLAVHSLSGWENPYITVQATVLTLHVLMPDQNPSSLGQGGMLRPVAARRQDLTLRPGELPKALAAIPAEAWPYGRVIAVEEQRGAAPSEEPAIRRSVEATLKTLNDLGVVADEWTDQNVQ